MTRDRWEQLRAITDDQLHLFFTSQAASTGITRTDLIAAAEHGDLWQAAPDLWAFTDTEKHPYEDWVAAWMSMNPDVPVAERRRHPDAIISHAAAAVIRDLGTLNPRVLDVTAPTTPAHMPAESAGVEVTIGDIGVEGVDWTIVEGLPVATPARLIADLAAADTEGSHLGTVIEEALAEKFLTRAKVNEIIASHIHRWGLTNPDTAVDVLIDASSVPEYPHVPRRG